jgi:hypothetical protein
MKLLIDILTILEKLKQDFAPDYKHVGGQQRVRSVQLQLPRSLILLMGFSNLLIGIDVRKQNQTATGKILNNKQKPIRIEKRYH